MATNNAINLKSSGIVTYDAAGTFTASTVTNHGVVTAGASNTVTSVAPGTSGNVLTSNGTDWVSSAAGTGNLLIATKTLTSAQIKAIHGTPIEIIAAPGSGKGIFVVGVSAKFTYGGSNVFVAGASQTVALFYNNGTTSVSTSAITNGMIVGTATKYSINVGASTLANQSAGVLDNVNLVAYNSNVTEISGNAANDNTINFQVSYYIITF